MLHQGRIIELSGEYEVIDCKTCGYKHILPVPTPEYLDEFYRTKYFDTHKKDYISTQASEQTYLMLGFKERLDFFTKKAQQKTLLDIGCGAGFFLDYAQKNGWQVTGVEPSESATEYATGLGLNVFNGSLDSFYAENNQAFDVIQLKNVLEHLPDPLDMIRKCRNLLREKGVLYIEVPNDYDFVQKVGVKMVKARNHWVCIPDHINYFNFRTLISVVKKEQFTVLKTDTTFPMYIFLWFGKNFIKDKAVGADVNQKRINFETFFYKYKIAFLRRFLYRVFAKIGIGRTVILYCQK